MSHGEVNSAIRIAFDALNLSWLYLRTSTSSSAWVLKETRWGTINVLRFWSQAAPEMDKDVAVS